LKKLGVTGWHSSVSSIIVVTVILFAIIFIDILAHLVESGLGGYLYDQLVAGLNHSFQSGILHL
jgi:hypothetical protein